MVQLRKKKGKPAPKRNLPSTSSALGIREESSGSGRVVDNNNSSESDDLPEVPLASLPMTGTGAVRRKRVKAEHKLALLQLILDKKTVLFGQFSTTIENRDKHEAWEQVRLKAMSLNICGPSRNQAWVRDKLWGTWRTRSLEKLDNKRNTGTAGGSKWQPSAVDKKIYDIIGRNTPVISGLQIPESGRPIQLPTENNETSNSDGALDEDVTQPRRKRKLLKSESLDLKRSRQIELLEIEIYHKKLKCLKLETDLNIEPSKFTAELTRLQVVQVDIVYD